MRDIIVNKDKICVQMHNNPDADAIASAYGVKHMLEHLGKKCDIVYCGEEISKPNLLMLIKEYNIDLINMNDCEELEYDLNVLVDCQMYESNVTDLNIETNIIIDHHKQKTKFSPKEVPFIYIDELVASCSTLVYSLLKEYNIPINNKVGSGLYYGLLTDTNKFANPLSPLDKDMVDYLEEENLYDKFLVNILIKENLSYGDLGIAHRAIMSYIKDERFETLAIVQAEKCEQNLLGYISDTLIETAGITIVIAFTEEDESKYRLSVRSCDRFIKADSIIEYLTSDIGGGGGTLDKGGGVIFKRDFYCKYIYHTIRSYIESKTAELYTKYHKLESGKDSLPEDLRKSKIGYIGIPKTLRYVDLEEHFERRDKVLIRTLEGDIMTSVRDTLIIVGIEGELYPISRNTFKERYELVDIGGNGNADCDTSINNLKYVPKLRSIKESRELKITDIPLPTVRKLPIEIEAIKIMQPMKIITKWDKTNPHTGEIEDYLVVNNQDDYYIINKYIFNMTYKVM